MAVKTTIEIQGKTYPFYRTVRGQYDFENAGFSTKQLGEGSIAAMMGYVYFTARDCAKRAGTPLSLSFDEFIDTVEMDVLEVFSRLKAAEDLEQKGKKQQPDSVPAEKEVTRALS